MSMMQGIFKDGLPAKTFTLKNRNSMTISVMDIGATWLSCRLPLTGLREKNYREVLLASENIDDYQLQNFYMGATIGRFANRIAKGCFYFKDDVYQLSKNDGEHCLHGGKEGFSHRRWLVEKSEAQKITFILKSDNGDQGFPGQVWVKVSYELTNHNEVIICYRALSDQATPINLTNHAYFNLMGADEGFDCLGHSLQVAADYYLPLNETLIPTGEIKEVTNTHFDFKNSRVIGNNFIDCDEQLLAGGIDHAFVLNSSCYDGITPALKLQSLDGAVSLSVATTKPAIQIYTGNFLQGAPSRKHGVSYKNYSGIAIAPEYFPDSPNQGLFPSSILQKGEEYLHTSRYCFTLK